MDSRSLKRIAAVWLLVGVWGPALAGDDHERARDALSAGEIQPLTAILGRAEQLLGGRMIEAELEREDGLWVYEVKLLRPNGRVVEALFDARSGELLAIEGAALEEVLRRGD